MLWLPGKAAPYRDVLLVKISLQLDQEISAGFELQRRVIGLLRLWDHMTWARLIEHCKQKPLL